MNMLTVEMSIYQASTFYSTNSSKMIHFWEKQTAKGKLLQDFHISSCRYLSAFNLDEHLKNVEQERNLKDCKEQIFNHKLFMKWNQLTKNDG